MKFSLPQWLKNNLGMKLSSLALALFLWLFVHIEERGRMVVRIPLQIVNIPEELMITNDVVGEIQVTLEGPKSLLSLTNPRLSPYRISLKGSGPGITRVQINPQNIKVPRGLQVMDVYPSALSLELKETRSLRVPVRVKLQGSPPEGYEIANVEIVPAQVEIIAPKEELRNLHYLYTEPVSLEGLTGVRSVVVPLALDHLKIKGITTQEVEVTLEISPRIGVSELAPIPVIVSGPGGPYGVSPPEVKIFLRGPEPHLLRLRRSPPKAEIILNEPLPSPRRFPPKISLPPELTLLKIAPSRVLVKPIK